MKCEDCGSENLKVDKTAKYDSVNVRTVRCLDCNYVFATYETYENPFKPKKNTISMPQSA